MALTPEAIAGLKARGYSQNQIDLVANAAKTGGTEAAKAALSGFGTVKPVPVPTQTVPRPPKDVDLSKVVTASSNVGTASYPAVTVPKTPAVTVPKTPAVTTAKSVPTSQSGVSVIGVRKKNVKNPNSVVTVPKTQAPIEAKGIMSKTPEQLADAKVGAISSSRDADVAAANDRLNKGLAVISQNSKAVRDLYGVDEQGNVDMSNMNSLAYGIKNSLDSFKAEKNKLLSSQESSQLNRVRGTLRQSLANRGINQANVSPELLISLSGELGIQAFDSIGKLRESTVNSVLAEEKSAMEKIGKLREAGMISANDAKTAAETLRANVADVKRAIDKGYVNDVIGAAESENARKATKASDLVNAVTKFGSALGLSGTGLASVNSYLSKFTDPTKAVTSMLSDLSNPNSALYKSVGSIEAARLAAAQNEYDLKRLAAEASLARATKSGEAKPFKLTGDQAASVAAVLGKPISDVTTEDFDYAVRTNAEFANKYAKDAITAQTRQAAQSGGTIEFGGRKFTAGAKNKAGVRTLRDVATGAIVSDIVLDSSGRVVSR